MSQELEDEYFEAIVSSKISEKLWYWWRKFPLFQAWMLAIKFLMHIFQALAYPVAYLFCKYAMNFGYGIYLERYATIRNTGLWSSDFSFEFSSPSWREKTGRHRCQAQKSRVIRS